MELTAKTIREITFGAKVRGYDPAEVDEFIAAIAEGVEELQERLRRAIDKAARSEAAAAVGGSLVATDTPASAPAAVAQTQSPSEISKVWERAVAAAEEAVAEAKATAQQLLSDAQLQSEKAISEASSEATRISEEAQRDLRDEVGQLEAARDQLKADVGRFSDYLEEEKAKVRSVLTRALAAIDDEDAAPTPMPQAESPVTSLAIEETEPEPEPAPPVSEESEPESESEPEPEWPDPQPWSNAPAASPEEPAPAEAVSNGETDDGQDPFLQELRRAVQDDAPLGPRDEPEDDNPVDRLYSSADDDDKKGFFPWKK